MAKLDEKSLSYKLPFPSSLIVNVEAPLSSVKVTDFGLILSPYKSLDTEIIEAMVVIIYIVYIVLTKVIKVVLSISVIHLINQNQLGYL